MTSIVCVVGTRPEAIKMAPVMQALNALPGIRGWLVSTGQHRELLRETLASLRLSPDRELDLMSPRQTPNDVASRVLASLPGLFQNLQARAVLVQGDTTTAFAAAFAAFNAGLPVGHVEAGLRTRDLESPFPEEANRQLIGRVARWHFAPTVGARDNLLAESLLPDRIHVVGNTSVDAILAAVPLAPRGLFGTGFLLVTLHRRESFGTPLTAILEGVADFLNAHPEARAVWPVHPNPAVRAAIPQSLTEHLTSDPPRLVLTEPQAYSRFVGLLVDSRVVLTDSGGIQEEAPSLGKTVLVAREHTERAEALEGSNSLVGRDRAAIREGLARAWDQPPYVGPLPAPNPFGDGKSGARIASILKAELT